MIFEWGETKSRINREKHGLAFDAVFAFDWKKLSLWIAHGMATGSNGLRRWDYATGKYIRSFFKSATVMCGSSA